MVSPEVARTSRTPGIATVAALHQYAETFLLWDGKIR